MWINVSLAEWFSGGMDSSVDDKEEWRHKGGSVFIIAAYKACVCWRKWESHLSAVSAQKCYTKLFDLGKGSVCLSFVSDNSDNNA